jgi:predicted NAD/FAD-binding protein
MSHPQKIAVIGSGISGLVAAYYLSKQYQVFVYEAANEIGGHTATKQVHVDGENYAIDTGFIVFNDRTYPNFIKLLTELKVDYQKTDMGFSVSCQNTGIEYAGTSLKGLFAQKSNLLNGKFWRMLQEIIRFNKACTALYENNEIDQQLTLGHYLKLHGYSDYFQNLYILPMVSAIWSSGNQTAAQMPMQFFVRFFHNHGLLTIFNQPQWYSIKGGSKSYLKPLTQSFINNIFCQTPVKSIRRYADKVVINTDARGEESYDQVILACHSDQALDLLADPTFDEQRILSAIPYIANDVCLHMDIRLLPKATSAWASWNYLNLQSQQFDKTALTYNMNILQKISSAHTFCVSVNANSLINPELVLGRYQYSHPVFTSASVAAQAAWAEISGINRTHYCGAYWRNGFHEDGVASGLRVVEMMAGK